MRYLAIGPQDALLDLEPCFDGLIQHHCKATRISPCLIKAQIRQESGFNPLAVSPTGPVGLGQFTKATWHEVQPGKDRRDVFDMVEGIVEEMVKLQYWANERGAAGGDLTKFMLAAYNAGPGNIVKCQEWAVAQGADPHQYGNVQMAFLAVFTSTLGPTDGPKKAEETTRYVEKIMEWFEKYRQAKA